MEMIKKPISNIKVYGLQDSIKKSKYPMSVDINSLNSEITKTVTKLATSKKGEGNDNWLNGVLVQFDLTFSIKAWVEAERYHFFDFVSSQSTMHKISKMDIRNQCNEYVTEGNIKLLEELKDDYINNPDIDIIDVRSEEEYKEGHINGSINIPSNYLSEIHISDERTLIVYSSTEKRSEMAAEELLKMGYKKVYSMGSILDWDDDLVEDSY